MNTALGKHMYNRRKYLVYLTVRRRCNYSTKNIQAASISAMATSYEMFYSLYDTVSMEHMGVLVGDCVCEGPLYGYIQVYNKSSNYK